jgi:hypothetical protein
VRIFFAEETFRTSISEPNTIWFYNALIILLGTAASHYPDAITGITQQSIIPLIIKDILSPEAIRIPFYDSLVISVIEMLIIILERNPTIMNNSDHILSILEFISIVSKAISKSKKSQKPSSKDKKKSRHRSSKKNWASVSAPFIDLLLNHRSSTFSISFPATDHITRIAGSGRQTTEEQLAADLKIVNPVYYYFLINMTHLILRWEAISLLTCKCSPTL